MVQLLSNLPCLCINLIRVTVYMQISLSSPQGCFQLNSWYSPLHYLISEKQVCEASSGVQSSLFSSMVRRLASLSSSRWIKMLFDMGELYSNNGIFCTIPIFFSISNIFISRGVGGRGGFGTEPFLSALQAKSAQVIHPHFRVMMIIFLHVFLQDTWLRITVYKLSIPFQAKHWQWSLLVSHQLLHLCSKIGQNCHWLSRAQSPFWKMWNNQVIRDWQWLPQPLPLLLLWLPLT